jgi:plastocyanin
MRGRAIPGSAVDLYVDGALAATLAADSTGLWTAPVTLADGDHTLGAIARLGGLSSPPSRTVNITTNSGLGWSPLSLRFTDHRGRSQRPVDDEGRTDETGWDIRLHPGENYTVSVKLCCTVPGATAQLIISGTQTVDLTDADGDQVYTGSFTSSLARHTAQSFVLVVQCGETNFSGGGAVLIDPEGVVYDVTTAAPLASAAVACMQAQVAAAGDSTTTVYDVWPAADYGQVNPQSTQADGAFSFFTPVGTYQLNVSRSGYQSYRSADIDVVSEAVHVDVPLTPEIKEAARYVVVITEYGFEPAYLAVLPGDIIEWVNMATDGHTATSLQNQTGAAGAGAAASFDSGLLLAGERYKFQTAAEGTFSVVDGANQDNVATLVVDATPNGLYLPFVHR